MNSLTIQKIKNQAIKKFPEVCFSLEEQNKFSTTHDILFNVELYWMMTNSELLTILNTTEEDAIETDVNKFMSGYGDLFVNTHKENQKQLYVHQTKYVNPSQYNTLQGRPLNPRVIEDAGYFLYQCDQDNFKIVLVTYEGSNADVNIALSLDNYDVTILYVTPYDFKLIEDDKKNRTHDQSFRWSSLNPRVFMKRVIYDAIEAHSSDIHIENHLVPTDSVTGLDYTYYINFRIYTRCERQSHLYLTKTFCDNLVKDLVEVCGGQKTDLDKPNGVVLSWLNPLRNGEVTLRVACSKTQGGYTAVIRVQQLSEAPKTINALGFSEEPTKVLHELASRTEGLVLITGHRGSGKNTTANAIISELYDGTMTIYEYSSPIEFYQPFIQYDYKDSRETLEKCIALSKKQDINIAVLNEIPDAGIAPAVYDLINSSVGVITTLHIKRLWNLPSKLRDYFGENYQELYPHLNGVVQQCMFVPLCPYCKKSVMHNNFTSYINDLLEKHNIKSFYERNPEGCHHCNHTGLDRRVQPLAEWLLFTDEIKTKLLTLEKPYEQSAYLRQCLEVSEHTLEYSIAEGISKGFLTPTDFNKLI